MRKEFYECLCTVCQNVFQDYPDENTSFPCLIFDLDYTAAYSLNNIAYFKQYARVEIFTETSEERSDIELQLIEKLFEFDWINVSNRSIPDAEYYRQNLTFERKL